MNTNRRLIISRFGTILKMMTFATCILLMHTVQAEQKKTLGDWDVHYIVIPTTFLTPEVAKANSIRRSESNALVNISILDKKTKKAQYAEVTGNARNLLGNNKPLTFKEVTEGEAIYYLAVVDFDDKETLRFTVDMVQSNISQRLTFQQKMYAE